MKRGNGSNTAKNGNSPRAEPPDPFRFGWRYVPHIDADGRKVSLRTPLTLDDVLHPQEGDHIPEHNEQERDRRYLADVLEWQLADNPHGLVLSDCLINWGVRGLRNHSPDISVFDGVADKNRGWGTFVVAAENARPLLVVEIVSPDTHDRQARDNDVVTKVHEYYRAGVPLYVIVDQERRGRPRRLLGYRRGARRYVSLPLDDRGRILLEPLRLRLGLLEECAVCWDAVTDERIGNMTATARARRAAETALAAETQARAAEAEARQAAEAALAAAQERIRELEAQHRSNERKS